MEVSNLLSNGLEPFDKMNLTALQWVCYALIVLAMFVGPGIFAFQYSFSLLLVKRAEELNPGSPLWCHILAPFYVAGLICADRYRLIKSWFLVFIMIPGLALTARPCRLHDSA